MVNTTLTVLSSRLLTLKKFILALVGIDDNVQAVCPVRVSVPRLGPEQTVANRLAGLHKPNEL